MSCCENQFLVFVCRSAQARVRISPKRKSKEQRKPCTSKRCDDLLDALMILRKANGRGSRAGIRAFGRRAGRCGLSIFVPLRYRSRHSFQGPPLVRLPPTAAGRTAPTLTAGALVVCGGGRGVLGGAEGSVCPVGTAAEGSERPEVGSFTSTGSGSDLCDDKAEP